MLNYKFFNKRKEVYKESEVIEEIDFYPKGKEFVFRLTKDTCEKIRTGRCNIEEIAQYKHDIEKFEKHCDSFKCSEYALSLLRNGFVHHRGAGILIYKHLCGHYSIHNGQHRTCLAAKLDIYIKAEIKVLDEPCIKCK